MSEASLQGKVVLIVLCSSLSMCPFLPSSSNSHLTPAMPTVKSCPGFYQFNTTLFTVSMTLLICLGFSLSPYLFGLGFLRTFTRFLRWEPKLPNTFHCLIDGRGQKETHTKKGSEHPQSREGRSNFFMKRGSKISIRISPCKFGQLCLPTCSNHFGPVSFFVFLWGWRWGWLLFRFISELVVSSLQAPS